MKHIEEPEMADKNHTYMDISKNTAQGHKQ